MKENLSYVHAMVSRKLRMAHFSAVQRVNGFFRFRTGKGATGILIFVRGAITAVVSLGKSLALALLEGMRY